MFDTIAAIATPPGSGGIGIVRISGPDAFRIASAVFREGGRPPDLTCRGLHVGWVVDPSTGGKLDHAVLLAFPGPRSYTTEDVAELQGHGGPALCGRILALVLAQGARLAAPGEFTKRAFLGGRLDLAQAEAVADLIEARGERALELAVAQLEGRLSRSVRAAREEAMALLAHIEAVIDFPDDVDAMPAGRTRQIIASAQAAVGALLATADTGLLARTGATVAIVGRPNVGKSSLLNALAQADKAIVTAQPGTTRDVVETGFQIAGIPLTVQDTAGIRESSDEVEAIGVERSRKHLAAADLRLLVVDAAQGLQPEDEALLDEVQGLPTVLVANKADIAATLLPDSGWLAVSALTGQGLSELEAAIVRHLPATHAPAEVAINARHRAALEAASAALDRATSALAEDLPLDCISADIREAVRSLGQVVGEDIAEEMLDVLFSRFCVGK